MSQKMKYFGMVIPKNGDKVFMLRRVAKHGIGKWEFPCGKGDEGETSLQAAAREFGEETGHVITEKSLQLGLTFMTGQISDPTQNVIWENSVYLLNATSFANDLRPVEPTTHDFGKWVLIKDLVQMSGLGNVTDMSAMAIPWLVLYADSLPK